MNWIKCSDRMPKCGTEVICYSKHGVEAGIKFFNNFYDAYDNDLEEVTHWMPLPEPPED